MTVGYLRAQYALLVEKFGLRPWELERLTPRQIQDVYLHPRDPDGQILLPRPAVKAKQAETPHEKRAAILVTLDKLLASGAMRRADYDAARRKLDEKFPAEEGTARESE